MSILTLVGGVSILTLLGGVSIQTLVGGVSSVGSAEPADFSDSRVEVV